MIRGPLLRGALYGGLLWSGSELLRLAGLGLLRFSAPARALLFCAAHAGLCVGAAVLVAALFSAPALLAGGAARARLWAAALTAGAAGLGAELSFRVTPPWFLPALTPLLFCAHHLGGELPSLRDGARPPSWRRSAALSALLAAAACAVNQRYLPMQLFALHAAVSALGLGLAALSTALLPLPRRGSAPAAAALLLCASLGLADEEVRHALFTLGQESRAAIFALRAISGRAGTVAEQRAPRPPAAVAEAAPACGPPLVERVVLLTVDCLRADHLRAYGYGRETAPHLSALARRAVLFERAYSLAPSTGTALRRLFAVAPAGAPAGVPAGVPAGAPAGAPAGVPAGVNEVSRLGPALVAARARARALYPAGLVGHFGEGILGLFPEREAVTAAADAADRALAPRAARVLRRPAPLGTPELLWAHLASPHLPYRAWPEGPDFGPRPRDRYDGEIAEADRALGAILAAAAEGPRGARTAVIVTADHGEELEEHGGQAHARNGIFDEELHVPLLVSLPGASPRRVAAPVSHDDVAATLAALLGGCAPGLRGRSLLPALSALHPAAPPPAPILVGPRAPFLTGALIDGEGRWKLAYSLYNRSLALYDLESDPGERLSLLTARPEIASRLRALLAARLAAP